MTKQTPYLSQLILGVSVCLFSGCASESSLAQNSGRASDSVPYEYTMAESYPVPASHTIRLTSEDADVSISGSDRDDIRIQVHYAISAAREKMTRFNYRVSVVDAGGELVVAEERHTGSRNFVFHEQVHSIEIEVPRNAHVTVREEDGSCSVRNIDGRVHLNLDDGSVHLENCAGDIAVAMDHGKLTQINCAALQYQPR